ncbi:Stage II sporulation protein E (SpoIIE) [Lachnospiraceae bacterium]|nr:Stage II sporulation protein E (SpoIIE) [Lachnospiraceae bacterium]
MEISWEFSCGMEVFGIAICTVVYYSFMQNRETYGFETDVFSTLLITAALNLFLDEWSWLVQGVATARTANMISNVLLYVNTYTMGLMFWVYACRMLDLRTKLIKYSTNLFIIMYFPAALICILNIWFPIYFSIDEAGEYRRAAGYIYRNWYYIIIIPALIQLAIKAKASWRTKILLGSFLILPLIAEIISLFKFGMSTKPTASMFAIMLNCIILIAKREREIVKTQGGLEIASQLQESVLPKDPSALQGKKNYEIFASMTPAQEVGGDFYDYFMIDDSHLAILVADVSDKGVGAAFFMMIAKVLIKSRAELGGSPSEIISYVDDRITKTSNSGMFVTVWFGIIDLDTGHVDACNAGHDYPAILMETGGFTVEKNVHGSPIAFLPGMPYPEYSFDMKPGHRLFLYTDGLVEAKRHDSSRFGTDRMLEVLNANKSADNESLIRIMREEIDKFADGEPQFDDITMLSFSFK